MLCTWGPVRSLYVPALIECRFIATPYYPPTLLLDAGTRLKLTHCRLQRSLGRGAGKLELCCAPLSIELSKEALDSLDYIER